jgi:hypothetical protein
MAVCTVMVVQWLFLGAALQPYIRQGRSYAWMSLQSGLSTALGRSTEHGRLACL